MVRASDYSESTLVDYLRKNLAKGHKVQNLKWALINEGYSKIEVDKAMRVLEEENQKEMKIQELRARKEIEKQSSTEVMTEMPKVEKAGFFSKIKSFFG